LIMLNILNGLGHIVFGSYPGGSSLAPREGVFLLSQTRIVFASHLKENMLVSVYQHYKN